MKQISWSDVEQAGGNTLLSPAYCAKGLVFTSGAIGSDPKTGELPPCVHAQTHLAMKNLQGVLRAAGSDLDHVLKVLLFVAKPEYGPKVNKIYAQYFPHAPARSCIVVGFPNNKILVELECVAEQKAVRAKL